MNKNGFTLLECIIAIGIFGIIAVVCFEMYFMEIKKVKILNEKQIFLQLAQSKTEQFLIENEKIEEKSGEFEMSFSEYTWEIKLSDITYLDTENDIEITPYILIVKNKNDSILYFLPFAKEKEENEK